MLENSSVVAELAASQEELSSMELVNEEHKLWSSYFFQFSPKEKDLN
jgi:hypothetical protein